MRTTKKVSHVLMGSSAACSFRKWAVLSVLLPWLAASSWAAVMLPVTLTPGSFNADIVVEAGAINDSVTHYNSYVTAAIDKMNNFTYFETGLETGQPTYGVPSGGVFTSAKDNTTQFALQPFNGNNALIFDTAQTSGRLTLSSSALYSGLTILTASTFGNGHLTATFNFSDGFGPVTASSAVTSGNWFDGTPYAWMVGDGVFVSGGFSPGAWQGRARIYQTDLVLPTGADAHIMSSIDFTWTGDSSSTRTAIFALSGIEAVPEPGAYAIMACFMGILIWQRRGLKR